MKNDFLEQFYTIDPETGDYIIEIALKDYDDIFNSWDSSLYNVRDLDTSLKSFLEECSEDIASTKKVILRFNIKDQEKSSQREKNIIKGIHNFFLYRLHITKRRLATRRRKAALYVSASILFTTLSFLFQSKMEPELVDGIIFQSLNVGGWVFLWEAFSLLFLQSTEMWRKKKQYRRLLDAPILFRYELNKV